MVKNKRKFTLQFIYRFGSWFIETMLCVKLKIRVLLSEWSASIIFNFSIELTASPKCSIRTRVLIWCWKPPLCHLCHNDSPILFFKNSPGAVVVNRFCHSISTVQYSEIKHSEWLKRVTWLATSNQNDLNESHDLQNPIKMIWTSHMTCSIQSK